MESIWKLQGGETDKNTFGVKKTDSISGSD